MLFGKRNKLSIIAYTISKHATTMVIAKGTDMFSQSIRLRRQIALPIEFTQFMRNWFQTLF